MSIGTVVLNLILTAFLYGLFPMIFAYTWKNQITKRLYFIICWCANFIVMIIMFVIVALDGRTATGGGYLLWTAIFSNIGYKHLLGKSIAVESISEVTDIEGAGNRFMYYCPKCGTVYSQASDEKAPRCLNCDNDLYFTHLSKADWQKLSVTDKETKKLEWLCASKGTIKKDSQPLTDTVKEEKSNKTCKKIYCNKCGNKLSEGSLFCSYCGARVE